jgi:hypothetical protein
MAVAGSRSLLVWRRQIDCFLARCTTVQSRLARVQMRTVCQAWPRSLVATLRRFEEARLARYRARRAALLGRGCR